MKTIRRADERGHLDHGWLDTWHTFSFGSYLDPKHMGFRALRVINDDRVEPGMGFGTHGHRDMEIITYVLDGALAHKDSMGNGSVIRPGNVQKMSAGRGVTHSEFNASESEPVHLLQIWILPDENGIQPSYEEAEFTADDKRGRLRLIASPDGRDGAVTIRADTRVYATLLSGPERVVHELAPGRHAWIHVATGSVLVDGESLAAGDAIAINGPGEISIEGHEEGEVLLFDLA
ncbi:MAG: pirin family protein [Blastocatellia bacterium]|nr:pirin family protein [Blastocatellia bacterium]MBK6426454.1 pirin family protein [Blastocatellia bacterium]